MSGARQREFVRATCPTKTFDAFENLDTSSGTWKGPFGYGGPHGYQSDPDSGLMLLGHRYYDSSTGRFLTRDPVKDGRNWYVYCDSNPLSSIDPLGLAWVMYGIDRRGLGHGWIMIIWDNGEIWVMENTMFGNNALYKSGTSEGKKEIDKFNGRADYEYWSYFDEGEIKRKDVRALFEARPNEYNLLTNNCTSFASLLFFEITGTFIYGVTPISIGLAIGRQNRRGKGNRPDTYGDVGTLPTIFPVRVPGKAARNER